MIFIAVSVAVVASIGGAEAADAVAISTTTVPIPNDLLAEMSLLTLDEFNDIRLSESPVDFGGLSGGETDELWTDAAIFEYEVATSHSDDMAETSPGYHPYLVCSKHSGLSGGERSAKINEAFQNTPNISASDLYTNGNLFHNGDDMSCGVMRAHDDTIHKVFAFYAEEDPNVTEHLSVNPLHSSMKMTANTVDVLRAWFRGGDGGTAVTISSTNPNTMTVNTMGLKMLLCPGVQDFGAVDVVDERIADDVKNFVIDDGGRTVAGLSFYHQRAAGTDGDGAVLTDRMRQWSAAVSSVVNWTKEDGSNACLDKIVEDNMMFNVSERVLEVKARYSNYEGNELAKSLGFLEEDMETCIWYMTYALAVSPQICALEPLTEIRTLCKNGTSDLSKCPPPESTTPPENSSSGIWLGSVWLLVSLGAFVGVAIM